MTGADPLATGPIRERVLRSWAESPARFREDANAEEDHALGGYRDRVVIELAQNAADAALRAGVPGRLRLSLDSGGPAGTVGRPVLTAANTGAPLDAAGVEALSTLRASAKRDETGTVGRFGVGFAAVVAVSDAPSIASVEDAAADGTGAGAAERRVAGAEWSRARARDLVAAVPALAGELERRGGHVPLLRLPFAAPPADLPEIPEGFATAVRLPLRDAAAVASVRAQLDQVGPALLLALPALRTVEIVVDGTPVRTLAVTGPEPGDAAARSTVVIDGVPWRTAEAHGRIPPELLADRPVEERARPVWQVRWALPEETGGREWGLVPSPGEPPRGPGSPGLPEGVPAVVHAPTPGDERLGLPALLIASFPLAPDRRHVAPGPLTDFLVERAAETYAALLRELPATPRLLDLVPGPIAAGELDARIRRALLARLPDVPLLPVAGDHGAAEHRAADHGAGDQGAGAGGAARARGRDLVAVDGPPALVELLAGEGEEAAVLPGLLPAGWPARHPALTALGVRRVELADVVDELATLDRPPAWWQRLYETLSGVPADALGALPVPLAPGDGLSHGVRVVRGPRGLLVAADGVDPAGLGPLGLRFVHPEAVHPLLLRLGAAEAGPRAVLADPAVRAAVEGSYDADDPDEIAAAVLGLVAAARLDPGEQPWLAELALPGADGDLYPAGELLLPGSPLRDLMAEDAPFGVVADEPVERWGAATLAGAGVLDGFALARGEEVDLPALADLAESHDLDAEDGWAEDVLARLGPQDLPPVLPEFEAVRDLELVADWDAALRLLAEPPWRNAIVRPAHVSLHDGRRVAVPSYTAWWLRRHPVLDGRRPGEFRLEGDGPGDEDPLAGLYDAVPAAAPKDRELLLALGVRTSLEELLAEPGGPAELLDRLGDPSRTVPRAHLGRLWTALADVPGLDVDPPERVRAVVDGEVEVVDAADALVLDRPDALPLLAGQPLVIAADGRAERLAALLDLPRAGEELPGVIESAGTDRPVPAAVRAVLPEAPGTYRAYGSLVVDGQAVRWWYGDDGRVHADGARGLARGLAWAAGRWEDRLLAEAVLRDPEALPAVLAEMDLEQD
ncbi:sacsin N-terminal ATP-binding-like domain-containing protein [Actinomadura viridis]|uniref:sacsin N-terminal ATP-binding-like domain-containing protein n=1 Tax=Actinomadura viridis TaxID=58110 RepID=UPI00369C4910